MRPLAIRVGILAAWLAIALLVHRATGIDFAQLTTCTLLVAGLALVIWDFRQMRQVGYVLLGLAAAGATVAFHGF